MFSLREKIKNPEVIMPDKNGRTSESYSRAELTGTYWRVYPTSAREVSALRLLDHRVDKFAPATGSGIIVTEAALAKFVELKTKTKTKP